MAAVAAVVVSACVPDPVVPPDGTTTTTEPTTTTELTTTTTTTTIPGDQVAPVITAPKGMNSPASAGGTGAVVYYPTSAVDDVDGAVPVTCSHPSGTLFPLGATTVQCSAVDAADNEGTASFVVNVTRTKVAIANSVEGVTNHHTSCGADALGDVRCWGSNWAKNSGTGLTGEIEVPTSNGVADAVDVSLGSEHGCAVVATGGGPAGVTTSSENSASARSRPRRRRCR